MSACAAFRFKDAILGAQRILRFFDRLVCTRRQEREDRRPQTGHISFRHQDRLAETFAYTWFNVALRCGMPPPLMTRRTGTPCSSIRSRITRVWNAVPSIAANNSSCAVCCQLPSEGDAAQFRIHEHRSIAVVPGQPQAVPFRPAR